MDKQQILSDVRKVTCQILKVPAERVVPSARLVDDLNVDSLFITQLAMGLEDEFGIEVDDANLPGLTTVQSVVDFVAARVGAS